MDGGGECGAWTTLVTMKGGSTLSTVTPNTTVAINGDAARAVSAVDTAPSDAEAGGVMVVSTRTLAAVRVTLMSAGVIPPPR